MHGLNSHLDHSAGSELEEGQFLLQLGLAPSSLAGLLHLCDMAHQLMAILDHKVVCCGGREGGRNWGGDVN